MQDKKTILFLDSESQNIVTQFKGNLNENPKFIDMGFPEGGTVVFGDCHGDAWKMIYLLVTVGVLKIADQDLTKLRQIYQDALDQEGPLDLADIARFKQLLGKAKLNKKIFVVYLGDLKGERGPHELGVDAVLEILDTLGVLEVIVASNHDVEYLKNFENRTLSKVSEIQHCFGGDQFCRSMINLAKTIEKEKNPDFLLQKITDFMANVYLPALRALDYRISKNDGPPIVFSHAEIDELLISQVAEMLGVPFKSEALLETIEQINQAFEEYKQGTLDKSQGKGARKALSDLFFGGEKDSPFMEMVWNREHFLLEAKPKETVYYLHGHDNDYHPCVYNLEKGGLVFSLDDEFGKGSDREGTFKVLYTQGTSLELANLPKRTPQALKQYFKLKKQEIEAFPDMEAFFNSNPDMEHINIQHSKLLCWIQRLNKIYKEAKALKQSNLCSEIQQSIEELTLMQKQFKRYLETTLWNDIDQFTNLQFSLDHFESIEAAEQHLNSVNEEWENVLDRLNSHLILDKATQENLLESYVEQSDRIRKWIKTFNGMHNAYQNFKADVDDQFELIDDTIQKNPCLTFFQLDGLLEDLSKIEKQLDQLDCPKQDYEKMRSRILIKKSNITMSQFQLWLEAQLQPQLTTEDEWGRREDDLILFEEAMLALSITPEVQLLIKGAMNVQFLNLKKSLFEFYLKQISVKDLHVLSNDQLELKEQQFQALQIRVSTWEIEPEDQSFFQKPLTKGIARINRISQERKEREKLEGELSKIRIPENLGEIYPLLKTEGVEKLHDVQKKAMSNLNKMEKGLKKIERNIEKKNHHWDSLREQVAQRLSQIQALKALLEEIPQYEPQLLQLKACGNSMKGEIGAKLEIMTFLKGILKSSSLTMFHESVQDSTLDKDMFKYRCPIEITLPKGVLKKPVEGVKQVVTSVMKKGFAFFSGGYKSETHKFVDELRRCNVSQLAEPTTSGFQQKG